jgi:hypothetical protein
MTWKLFVRGTRGDMFKCLDINYRGKVPDGPKKTYMEDTRIPAAVPECYFHVVETSLH